MELIPRELTYFKLNDIILVVSEGRDVNEGFGQVLKVLDIFDSEEYLELTVEDLEGCETNLGWDKKYNRCSSKMPKKYYLLSRRY